MAADEGTKGSDNASSNASTNDTESKVLEVLNGLVAKHGGESGALKTLIGENFDLRTKNRDLRAKLPAEGSVVLAKTDADELAAYRGLNLSPKDLAAALSDGNQAKADLATLRTADTVRQAADLAGYKPTVLTTLVKASGVELAITEADDPKGGAAKVRTVTVKDGDSKPVELGKYAEAHWTDHLPALKAERHGQPGTPARDANRQIPTDSDDRKSGDRAMESQLRRGGYQRLM